MVCASPAAKLHVSETGSLKVLVMLVDNGMLPELANFRTGSLGRSVTFPTDAKLTSATGKLLVIAIDFWCA